MSNYGSVENEIWEDVERRNKLRDEFKTDEFYPLEQHLAMRREALNYHLSLINANQYASKETYQLVRQSYNKLIVAESQKIVDTYNTDGTQKSV